jgi:pimeloyl-ACP methyl ester carboxylesterase
MFIIMERAFDGEGRNLQPKLKSRKHGFSPSLVRACRQGSNSMIKIRALLIFFLSFEVFFLAAVCRAATLSETEGLGVQRRIEFTPCGFPSYDNKVLCGKYEVFEDRVTRQGRKIALHIVMLPALRTIREPDPVFFLSGGPGQGAARIASAGEDSLMSQLRRRRDLIFVDQRGTGDSQPLACDLAPHRASVQAYFGELFPVDKVRACRAALEGQADLRFYTTPMAMADLDEVRAALGYETIDLYGVSYGTLAALQYLRQYPEHVRALALAGVATPAAKLPLHFAKGAQTSMERLIYDCAGDDLCRTAFPDLQADFAKVIAKLDRGQVIFASHHPKSGETQNVMLSRGVFTEHLKNLLYNVTSMSLVPLLIHHASHGDWTAFSRIVTRTSTNASHASAIGMYLTVTCSESVPFIREDEIARETKGTLMGDYRIRAHQRACREWPKGDIAADYFAPVKSTVPVLMLSGELDGATPAQLGAVAAKSLSNSRQILLRNTAHDYNSDCVKGIIAQFIANGSTRELNTDCVKDLRRPPFARDLPRRYAR